MSPTARAPRARPVLSRILAFGLTGVLAAGMAGLLVPATSAHAADAGVNRTSGDDGLSLAVSPDLLLAGDARGFSVSIDDANTSGTDFSLYKLSGIPAGWTVKTASGATLQPVSPDPVIYEIDRATTTVTVVPPAGFSGTLKNVQVSRASDATNLITDFDGGTFNYLGQAKPTLDAASSPYKYHDPHTLTGPSTLRQYSPHDGQYTIWPTGMMNGPDLDPPTESGQTKAYNNYWADLRSVTHPMTTPDTATITQGWNDSYRMPNTRAVTDEESAQSGKFLIVNGSSSLGNPHDVVTTTITGLTPNTDYTMSGYVANLSDDPHVNTVIAPVRVGFVVGGEFIGSSQDAERQPGPTSTEARWTRVTSTVNTGSETSLTFGVRNYKAGGFGNDFAIDQLSLFPLASVTTDLTVIDPGYEFAKTSDPAPGTTVNPGDTITYTLTGTNTGDTTLNTAISDDLTGVLNNATLTTAPTASTGTAGTAPTLNDTTLSWTGDLPAGEKITISYTVTINDGAYGITLKNTATSTGTPPTGPPIETPPGETTHHTPPQPMPTPTPTPTPPGDTTPSTPPQPTPPTPPTLPSTGVSAIVGVALGLSGLILALGAALIALPRRRGTTPSA